MAGLVDSERHIMRLSNTLSYSDRFLRRMISWICKEIDLPVKYVWQAEFKRIKNCRRESYSGTAFLFERRIAVRLGEEFPSRAKIRRIGVCEVLADQMEGLVYVTAHELAHLEQYKREVGTRGRGYIGGSELNTDQIAFPVLRTFRAQREVLLAKWNEAQVEPETKPVVSVVEKRAHKAQVMLEQWTKKLKLAQTKIKKYRTKVRYYERKAATSQSGKAIDDIV